MWYLNSDGGRLLPFDYKLESTKELVFFELQVCAPSPKCDTASNLPNTLDDHNHTRCINEMKSKNLLIFM
jgi:hypothetical protein